MMKFKNIFGILAISAVSMMTVSCSEDTMDRINRDEAHPGQSVVSAKFQLTDAIVASVFTTNTGNFSWYVSSYLRSGYEILPNKVANLRYFLYLCT